MRSGPRATLQVASVSGRAAGAPGEDRRVEVLLVPELGTERILLEEVHVVEALGRMVAGVLHQRLVWTLHVREAARARRLHALALASAICALVRPRTPPRARPGVAADEDRAAVIPGVERHQRDVRPALVHVASRARVGDVPAEVPDGGLRRLSGGGVATLVNRIRTLFGDWSAGSPPQVAFAVVGNCRV